jgi:7-carboxy-7-deazaguanine synthase
MRLIEIFASVQGEGPDAGLPTVFVRTARCNLRCVWCDSEYTFGQGEEANLPDVINKVRAFGLPAVCLTGGEPTLTKELPELAERLVAEGFQVSVFTNGTRPLDLLPRAARKVVDVKPPSALVGDPTRWDLLQNLDAKDVVKFVLREEADYRWSLEVATNRGLLVAREGRLRQVEGRPQVWFAPAFGDLEPKYLVEWLLRDKVEARVNLQLHKFIWEPDARGV